MDAFRRTVCRYLVDEPYRRLPPDELWTRFRDDRDEAAFRVLLERVGGRVYARCRAVLRDDALAEDAFQEAFAAWVRHRQTLPTYPAAVAWLYRTATNAAKTHRRWRVRLWRREAVAVVAAGSATGSPAGVADREQSAMVAEALVRLPERERRAVELVYLEGLTHDQAAAALGWSRGSVATYVGRGLGRLRQSLGGALGATAAGLAAVETALQAARPGLLPARVAELAEAAWAKAAVPPAWSVGWLPMKAVTAATVASGGLAVGLIWNRHPAPGTPTPPAQVQAAEETVPERNLRIFRAEVLPRQLAALRPLALGGGDVELESVDARNTEVRCVYRLRHRVGDPPAVSRLVLDHYAHDRITGVWFDATGRGRLKWIDHKVPIILWRNPFTRAEVVLQVDALDEALRAFTPLPRDDRTQAEAQAHMDRLTRAIRPYLGTWYAYGDAGRWRTLTLAAGRLVITPSDGPVWDHVLRDAVQLNPDTGRSEVSLFNGRPLQLSADGRRLEWSGPGEWYTRDPLPKP